LNLSNFKIVTKIGIGFGILIVVLVVMGVTALSQMRALDSSTQQIATNNLPSVQLAASIRDLVNDMRRAEARHVMATTDQDKDAQEARINSARKKLSELEADASKVFDSPEEVSAFKEFQKDRVAWYATWEQLRQISRKGPSDYDEAQKIYTTVSSKAFNAAFAEAQKLGEINEKAGAEAWVSAQGVYSSARAIMVSVISIAILLAVVLGWFIAKAIATPIAKAVASAQKIAAGDMTESMNATGTDETAQLLRALDEMRQSLSTVVANVRQNSESVASASAEIAQGNNDLSARTESQASALEETAASMEELNSQVQNNAENARQASQLATSASTVAVKGGEVVGRVVDTMKDINDSSRKIADIIGVIDGIAFQTNILALNAAVEAARAGDQGRGFAVVASEVRSLAGRSAEAAKEIKRLIGASVEKVEQGTVLVDQAGTTMSEVVSSIQKVSELVSEISSASIEQSAGVAQVSEAVAQMDQATQQNAALVEEMAAAASSLKGQAHDLVQVVAVFKLNGGDIAAKVPVRSASQKPFNGDERRAAQVQTTTKRVTPKTTSLKKEQGLPKAAPSLAKPANAKADEWETF